MQLLIPKFMAGVIAVVLLTAPTLVAASNVISAADFTGPNGNVGYNTLVLPFATATSLDGKNFNKNTIDGFQNVGALGGVQGEFDVNSPTSQGMLVSYLTPQTIQSITIGFLYPKGVFDDLNNEVAKITFNGVTTYTLEATGSNTFLWSGGGTVTNLSLATGGGAGEWKITDPFVGSVTSIEFSPFDTGVGSNSTNSDFGINEIVSAVPEPISFLLLGSAMVGAILRKKLRQA